MTARWQWIHGERNWWLVRQFGRGQTHVGLSVGATLLDIALPLRVGTSGWTAWPWGERSGTFFVAILCFCIQIHLKTSSPEHA